MNEPLFAIGQHVLLDEQCTLFTVFPAAVGKVLERRFSLENERWMYMVHFAFGDYPLPESQLVEQKAGEG